MVYEMETLSEERQRDQGVPPAKAEHYVCRYCRMEINECARICHHCQSNQNILIANLDRFALIISMGLLILAFMQFDEARNDRISAEKALNQAEQARIGIEKMDIHFKSAIKAFAENNYIIAHQYVTWHSTKSSSRWGRTTTSN